ncbi:hypothetical protein PO124_05035 [Bacillus licheniformis]|nr:hypothetical protein [Bacillus licheniformis]
MTEIGIVLEEIRFISRRLKNGPNRKGQTAVSHIGSKASSFLSLTARF